MQGSDGVCAVVILLNTHATEKARRFREGQFQPPDTVWLHGFRQVTSLPPDPVRGLRLNFRTERLYRQARQYQRWRRFP
ncbi:hypothetical protein KCP69_19050 [Salmonella enterica subsp. enterica]|nr:hypothetical protein KCP69_19050 [Salmonella enterica subsp. enterica]